MIYCKWAANSLWKVETNLWPCSVYSCVWQFFYIVVLKCGFIVVAWYCLASRACCRVERPCTVPSVRS